jgi:predicted peptidase
MRGIVRNRRVLIAAVVLSWACGGGDPTGPSTYTSGTPSSTNPDGTNPGGTNPGNTGPSTVPEAGTFVKRTTTIAGVNYGYQVFVPAAYNTSTRWPVILSMHGAGSRGSDNTSQMTAGLPTYIRPNAATFPAFAVFPQIPAGAEQTVPRSLQYAIVHAALDSVIARYAIDTKRQYVTGLSMGGSLTYELAFNEPTRWAAAVPVAALYSDKAISGDPNAADGSSYNLLASHVTPMPVWVFHGRYDPTVPASIPRSIVAALQAAKDPVQYTEFSYAGAGHNAATWDSAYVHPTLWTWLLAQHR